MERIRTRQFLACVWLMKGVGSMNMKLSFNLLLVILLATLCMIDAAWTQEQARTSVGDLLAPSGPIKPKLLEELKDRVIDPQRGVYGLSLGATEDETVRRFGKPVGIVELSESHRAYLYGKAHLLGFKKGRFYQLIVGNYLIARQLHELMDADLWFDSDSWKLTPGIKRGMSVDTVAKLLKRDIPHGVYIWTYTDGDAQIELGFSRHTTKESGKPEKAEFQINGFSITHAKFQ